MVDRLGGESQSRTNIIFGKVRIRCQEIIDCVSGSYTAHQDTNRYAGSLYTRFTVMNARINDYSLSPVSRLHSFASLHKQKLLLSHEIIAVLIKEAKEILGMYNEKGDTNPSAPTGRDKI